MIEVKELSKQFKKTKAVDSISFSVNDGEIVGLLGENGAGKTTTLRMLATMLKATEGTAIVNGFDIIKDPDKVRGQIGILFGGEVGLYDRLTARENMKYFAELNGLPKEKIEERTKYILRSSPWLSLPHFIFTFPSSAAAGQGTNTLFRSRSRWIDRMVIKTSSTAEAAATAHKRIPPALIPSTVKIKGDANKSTPAALLA